MEMSCFFGDENGEGQQVVTFEHLHGWGSSLYGFLYTFLKCVDSNQYINNEAASNPYN